MSFVSALALRQHVHQVPLKSWQKGSTRKKKKVVVEENDNKDDCNATDVKNSFG